MDSSMPRIRLAIVSPDPTDNSQGVERFCHTLAQAVAAHAIDARVISREEFNDDSYDVALTNALVSVRSAIPRIHVYHGCAIPQISRSHAEASWRWRAKFMIEASIREFLAGFGADRVAVSNGCASEIRRWYGLPTAVIPNGVDTRIFQPHDREAARQALGMASESRIALFIGRPEWRKRPDMAIAAARKHGYEIHLAAGRGFEGMAWLGRLEPTKLALAIAAADVVLMPTQYEACSLALLEALAVGTPVVTTDAGWIPDLLNAVPEYSPLVSSIGDEDAFVSSLGSLGSTMNVVEKARTFVRSENSLSVFGERWSSHIRRVHESRLA